MKSMFYNTTGLVSSVIFLFSSALWASPVAVVSSVKDGVFGVLKGKTRVLRPGDHVENLTEILTEEGGRVSFSDYFDRRYDLAGSGHIQFGDGTLRLRRGYLRVESPQENRPSNIETANAVITHRKGKGIISFDESNKKTQVLSIEGRFSLANSAESFMKTHIEGGYFSFVHRDHDNGRPRIPLPAGPESVEKITSLFIHFEPTKGERSVASLPLPRSGKGHETPEKKEHRREVASFYRKKIQSMNGSEFSPNYDRRSQVVVNVFGKASGWQRHTVVEKKEVFREQTKRMPSSVSSSVMSSGQSEKKPISRGPASIIRKTPSEGNDPFEANLKEQYKKQMRHDDEVNSLIDALKSYKSNYSKSY